MHVSISGDLFFTRQKADYVRAKNMSPHKILDHILYSDILTGRPEFEETISMFIKRTSTNPHA